jgi:hypothetical protein
LLPPHEVGSIHRLSLFPRHSLRRGRPSKRFPRPQRDGVAGLPVSPHQVTLAAAFPSLPRWSLSVFPAGSHRGGVPERSPLRATRPTSRPSSVSESVSVTPLARRVGPMLPWACLLLQHADGGCTAQVQRPWRCFLVPPVPARPEGPTGRGGSAASPALPKVCRLAGEGDAAISFPREGRAASDLHAVPSPPEGGSGRFPTRRRLASLPHPKVAGVRGPGPGARLRRCRCGPRRAAEEG